MSPPKARPKRWSCLFSASFWIRNLAQMLNLRESTLLSKSMAHFLGINLPFRRLVYMFARLVYELLSCSLRLNLKFLSPVTHCDEQIIANLQEPNVNGRKTSRFYVIYIVLGLRGRPLNCKAWCTLTRQ